ncbi:MAG: mucoidy inhibitor MuiA family protein [Kofleriaceae bacterium]
MAAIASKIDSVTVYRDGARVRRTARVSASTTPTSIHLGGLPLGLVDASVRVTATGAIRALDRRVVVETPEVDPTLAPADPAALLAARQEVRRCDAELGRLRHGLRALAQLAPRERDDRDLPPPSWAEAVDARLAVARLRGEREAALAAALAVAEDARRVAGERLARAEDAHQQGSAAHAPRSHELRKAVRLTVAADADVTGELTVEYLVRGARWAPTYAARLRGGEATLELRAVVAQRTEEDWAGVRLVLSTATATGWTELPELPSQRIGRRQPPPPRTGWRPPPTGAASLYADWDRAFAGRDVEEPGPTWDEPPSGPDLDAFAEHEEAYAFADKAEGFDDEAARPPPPPAFAPAMAMSVAAPPPMAPAAAPVRSTAAPAKKLGKRAARMAPPGGAGAARRELGAAARGLAAADLAEPFDDGELVAPAELLAYGDLRLRSPTSPARGRLVRASDEERYQAGAAPGQAGTVARALRQHEAVRAQLDRLPTPPGTHPAWSDRYDYAIASDGVVDVPADGTWHALALGRAAAPVALRHVVVPRESTDVFREARLDNPHDAPLLPGPMDVYDGADFLLTTEVGFTPPRGQVTLGLGVDPQIKVARTARFEEETTGLLRGGLQLGHHVEITARNLGARAIDLEVRERVPVAAPGDDEVAVVVDGVNPAWEPWTPEPRHPHEPRLRGGHRWRRTLAAGATEALRVDYHVKIPSKAELVGGNRREP